MRDNAISLERQATYKGTEMAADGLPIHYPPSRRLYGGGKAGVETRDGAVTCGWQRRICARCRSARDQAAAASGNVRRERASSAATIKLGAFVDQTQNPSQHNISLPRTGDLVASPVDASPPREPRFAFD